MRSRLLHVFTLLMVSLLALLAVPAHAEEPTPSTVVSIPDARFRSCLVWHLGVPFNTPLTAEDLASLTWLSCAYRSISDLTGWEHLRNVTTMNLGENNLSGHLTIPEQLSSLTVLDLRLNSLTSVALPATATQLREIELNRNKLTSIKVPDTLVSLERLSLYKNQFSSIHVPPTLTSLTTLDVSMNLLSSLSVPATLTKLRQLHGADNNLSSFSAPNTLTSLVDLHLANNHIRSVTLPDTLLSLEKVVLDRNELSDLSGLASVQPAAISATDQHLHLPATRTGIAVPIGIRDHRGQAVIVDPVAGVRYAPGLLHYDQPGDYTLTFHARDGLAFSGRFTQFAEPPEPPPTVPAPPAVPGPPSGKFGDHSGDSVGDIFAVNAAGELLFFTGSTFTTAGPTGLRGTGWGSMTYLAQVADVTGDGLTDLLARRGSDQSLWIYRSLGDGWVTGWKQVGKNWGGMDQIVHVGNLAGGNTQYVVSRRASDGKLFRYTLTPRGLEGIVELGQHWGGMRQILSVGDFTGDQHSDVLAIRTDGTLWAYPGTPQGRITSGRQVGHGWNTFTRAFTVGDLSGDGVPDLVGQRGDGRVFTYPNRMGTWGTARQFMSGTQVFLLMA